MTKAILIAKWSKGSDLMGKTTIFLTLRPDGRYSVSEASPIAMNFREVIGVYSDVRVAVNVFGLMAVQL